MTTHVMYDYRCNVCGVEFEMRLPYEARDEVYHCEEHAQRLVSAPKGFVHGKADGSDKYAGADAFTKEALGIKGELPKTLRADYGLEKS